MIGLSLSIPSAMLYRKGDIFVSRKCALVPIKKIHNSCIMLLVESINNILRNLHNAAQQRELLPAIKV